jgi:hypothetical protein
MSAVPEVDAAVSRGSGRHAFDALERRLAALAPRHPVLALSGAGALGRLRNRLSGRWPSPEQVRLLFPDLSPGAAARVAWRIGALEARNRVLVECLRRAGRAPLRRLVRAPPDAFAALRPPLVLGLFHVGAIQALGPAFERMPAPVLVLRQGLLVGEEGGFALETTEGDLPWRAAVLQRALQHLAGGGFVAVALDVAPGAGIRCPCLGGTLELPRGPFALARRAAAPIVPLVARWRRRSVEVIVGEALAPEAARGQPAGPAAAEQALAAAAASWLERYLRAAPAELGLGLLRDLLRGPLGPALDAAAAPARR